MKTLNIYTLAFTCQRGILDYVNGHKKFVPLDKVESTEFDQPNEPSLLVYDETELEHDNDNPAVILETEIQNPENEQKLILEWVTLPYADSDLYQRELCTTTNDYCEWKSKRTRFIENLLDDIAIFGKISNDREKEWNDIRSEYCDPLGWDWENKASFQSILDEINR